MTVPKKAVIKSLFARETFKVILKEDLPPDGNILTGCFAIPIKSFDDAKFKCKARFVIVGHRDIFNELMVYSTSTLQP